MTDSTHTWQSFKADGATILDKIRGFIREGNVRRVVVEHDGKTIAEFSLSVGVVGVLLAPVAAAIGTLVALLKDCTIHVEREATAEDKGETARAS